MTFQIVSKTYGMQTFILDADDYARLVQLGGKWCVCKKRGRFYAQKRINKHIIELQRFIMQPKKGQYVDHINGDTLDNTRNNLRVCTNAANLRNGRIRLNNTSGYKGVYFSNKRQKWVAQIRVNYRVIALGRFITIEEAIEARQKAELLYWSV